MLNRKEMIIPEKHMNLFLSPINIGATILTSLKPGQEILYDKLIDNVISQLGEDSKENFPYALTLLFALDKIEYLEESDKFKLK